VLNSEGRPGRLRPASSLPAVHRVGKRAVEESRLAGHTWIGCDHAYVALATIEGVASRALLTVGATLEVLRTALTACDGLRVLAEDEQFDGYRTLTPRLMCAFERSRVHAVLRGEPYDEQHILLALLDEVDCLPIAEWLKPRGIDLERIVL
jgi:hypothetical protein